MTRFAWLDFRAALRERKVLVAAGLFVYAVLMVPALLSKPPAHVVAAVTSWFGTGDPFALFLYLWTDLALNKLLAVVAVVLAGGLVTRERDLHLLPVLWAKPITPARYFLVRACSALGVMTTLYVGAHVLGAPWFAYTVDGFRLGAYLVSMALHLWAALFATALAATVSVVVRRRGLAALVTLLTVFSLIGASFIGFYNPAWATYALVNPFSLGVQALAHVDDLALVHILPPLLALVGLVGVTLGIGAGFARRMEA
ncbi:MAG: hypothetical protein V4850_20990 [Myxococcota bacterium]